MEPVRIVPGPGQESVWDYPRPPALERTDSHLVVEVAGVVVADTRRGWRVLETSQPPAYYFPPDDVRLDLLEPSLHRTFCEWKGQASYLDVVGGDQVAPRAGWYYPSPEPVYAALRGHVAVYAGAMDRCLVDGELVLPQPGGFYGGWITADLVGPFKGGPGTLGW